MGLPYYETSAATGEGTFFIRFTLTYSFMALTKKCDIYAGVEDAIDGLLTLVMARIERSLEEERRKVSSEEPPSRRRSFRMPGSISGRRRIHNVSTVDLSRATEDTSYCSC